MKCEELESGRVQAEREREEAEGDVKSFASSSAG